MARPLEDRRFLWLDDAVGVVDKPAMLLTTPAPGRSEPVLLDRIAATLGDRGESPSVFAVHRIDEETSGSLAFARSEEARRGLEAIFKQHRAERVYHCLVHGAPRRSSAVLECRLQEEGGIVRVVDRDGQVARMEYRAVLRLDGMTMLACRLDTGRRNQIRVQLAAIGCPLVGDRKYGRRGKTSARRTMLHATALGFDHPLSGARIEVIAPFPEDFERLIGAERLAALRLT